tara:strand:- start:756 stop:1883 length:1128 start_codon:yes stop_codon:yes gene_type:complete
VRNIKKNVFLQGKFMGEIRGLTGLRIYLALWVVFFHIHANPFAPVPAGFFQSLFYYGDNAVPFFFALSGFLLHYVYGREMSKGIVPISLSYIYKRILKLYPVHLFCLLIFLIMVGLANHLGYKFSNSSFFSSEALAENFLLIQAWFVPQKLSWNIVAWSISVEIFLYLIVFPILVWKIFYHVKIVNCIVAFMVVFLFRSFEVYTPWIHTGVTFFVLGFLAYTISEYLNFLKDRWFTEGLLGFSICAFIYIVHKGQLNELRLGIAAFAFLTLIPKSKILTKYLFDNPLCHYWGIRSYSLYMIHVLIQTVIFQVQKKYPNSFISDFWVWYLLVYFTCLFMGTFLTYKYIEEMVPKQLKIYQSKVRLKYHNFVDARSS